MSWEGKMDKPTQGLKWFHCGLNWPNVCLHPPLEYELVTLCVWFAQKHDDVIKGNIFRVTGWSFVRGIQRSPVNSLHKGQWRGVSMFSLICAWINDWVNNREAGDLRRHRAYYDVIVMSSDSTELVFEHPPVAVAEAAHLCKLTSPTTSPLVSSIGAPGAHVTVGKHCYMWHDLMVFCMCIW